MAAFYPKSLEGRTARPYSYRLFGFTRSGSNVMQKRNRLTENRARDFVYVHSNVRLLKNIQAIVIKLMLKQLLNGNSGRCRF